MHCIANNIICATLCSQRDYTAKHPLHWTDPPPHLKAIAKSGENDDDNVDYNDNHHHHLHHDEMMTMMMVVHLLLCLTELAVEAKSD